MHAHLVTANFSVESGAVADPECGADSNLAGAS